MFVLKLAGKGLYVDAFPNRSLPDLVSLLKRSIARFARGNVAAQNGRVLLPDEQDDEHRRARRIAARMHERA